MRLFAAWIPLLVLPVFHSSINPVPPGVRAEVIASHHYYSACPVPFSQLRILTVTYWGWDDRTHQGGQILTNEVAAPELAQVFHKLYELRFPIRHMSLIDEYGPPKLEPKDGDFTYSFSCRQAVPSPCTGGTATGNWSMHAYGEAVDLNPVENPYVGCGMTRDPTALSYVKRTPLRKGMVTPAVLKAFESVGWGWGGAWAGSTKDYMHFSSNGH